MNFSQRFKLQQKRNPMANVSRSTYILPQIMHNGGASMFLLLSMTILPTHTNYPLTQLNPGPFCTPTRPSWSKYSQSKSWPLMWPISLIPNPYHIIFCPKSTSWRPSPKENDSLHLKWIDFIVQNKYYKS
jgi:hypothetical protein